MCRDRFRGGEARQSWARGYTVIHSGCLTATDRKKGFTTESRRNKFSTPCPPCLRGASLVLGPMASGLGADGAGGLLGGGQGLVDIRLRMSEGDEEILEGAGVEQHA